MCRCFPKINTSHVNLVQYGQYFFPSQILRLFYERLARRQNVRNSEKIDFIVLETLQELMLINIISRIIDSLFNILYTLCNFQKTLKAIKTSREQFRNEEMNRLVKI